MNILVWRRNADDRIILETDAAAIASRVSRPRADTTDIVINEQTVRDACKLFFTLRCSTSGSDLNCAGLRCDTDIQSRHSGIDCSSVSDSCRYKNRFGEMDRLDKNQRNTCSKLLIQDY
jgi:hypothetical protein